MLAALRPRPVEAPAAPPPAAPVSPPDEAAEVLAEVVALIPRVNAHWRTYIATRLEVDTYHAERLRRVRDWVLAHAEVAPPERTAAEPIDSPPTSPPATPAPTEGV